MPKPKQAKSRQLKEVFRQRSTGAVEGVESVEKAGTRQPNWSTRNGAGKSNGLRKLQMGRVAPMAVLANVLRQTR
jgi:hypothetical protein